MKCEICGRIASNTCNDCNTPYCDDCLQRMNYSCEICDGIINKSIGVYLALINNGSITSLKVKNGAYLVFLTSQEEMNNNGELTLLLGGEEYKYLYRALAKRVFKDEYDYYFYFQRKYA